VVERRFSPATGTRFCAWREVGSETKDLRLSRVEVKRRGIIVNCRAMQSSCRRQFFLRYAISLLLALVCATAGAQTKTPVPHRRETDTETIWTSRYSNCNYAYSVLLPAGVVGHGAKNPDPNGGFTINPAAPESGETFNATESSRYIDVFSFYDLEDHDESTSGTIDYYLTLGEISGEKNVAGLSRRNFSLAGLSAKRVEVRWVENATPVRRDRIIAYRRAGGILYQLTLQSPEKSYARDEQLFDRIVERFRLSKLPTGDCSDD
jgi:hypothetical protein